MKYVLMRAGKRRRMAVEEVYTRFDRDLRGFIRASVRDPDAAEDVLQGVYRTKALVGQGRRACRGPPSAHRAAAGKPRLCHARRGTLRHWW